MRWQSGKKIEITGALSRTPTSGLDDDSMMEEPKVDRFRLNALGLGDHATGDEIHGPWRRILRLTFRQTYRKMLDGCTLSEINRISTKSIARK